MAAATPTTVRLLAQVGDAEPVEVGRAEIAGFPETPDEAREALLDSLSARRGGI